MMPNERYTRRDWKELYKRLRARDPALYKKAIEYAEGCAINHRLSTKAAADIENSFVVFALELTGGVQIK